jgi:hypothetical protein
VLPATVFEYAPDKVVGLDWLEPSPPPDGEAYNVQAGRWNSEPRLPLEVEDGGGGGGGGAAATTLQLWFEYGQTVSCAVAGVGSTAPSELRVARTASVCGSASAGTRIAVHGLGQHDEYAAPSSEH